MSVPLCVDLDGTLIKTDALLESVVILLKKNPCYLVLMMFWLLQGVAHFKAHVSTRVLLNPSRLPYSNELLAYLNEEYARGRELILVTGSDENVAQAIANHVGIFSRVFASDGFNNLVGHKKRQLLTSLMGEKKFDYVGNESNDLNVWSSARKAIVVNGNARLVKRAKKIASVDKTFPREKSLLLSFLTVIRVQQYIKNTLVFVPLFTGKFYVHSALVFHSIGAFIAFCLAASSVYIINDLIDIDVDRQHRTKHKRPFAAGHFPISYGLLTVFIFTCMAFYLALYLDYGVFLWLASYFLLAQAYSFYFKKIPFIDVLFLALFYVIRILAGIAAIGAEYSMWLIGFALFFFLSLGFVKRYAEVYLSAKENKVNILGRGYQVSALHYINALGLVSGAISVLIFACYIHSNKAVTLYHHPHALWIVCLLLLSWITRVWVLTMKGLMQEDPISFALKDRLSLLTLGLIIFIFLLII